MTTRLTVAEIEDSLTMLPAFPQIVLELLSTPDDETGRQAMMAFFRRDPISAVRLQAQRNGLDGHDRWSLRESALISSLDDFVALLGSPAEFLEHGLAVGLCAQELGWESGLNREFALVAGILHDIGQAWLFHCHPRTHSRVADLVVLSGRTSCEVEREVFGMDHGEIGGHLARAWGLPTPIVDAIAQHHRPVADSSDPMVASVYLAERYGHASEGHCVWDEAGDTCADAAARVLALHRHAELYGLLGQGDAGLRPAKRVMH